MSKKFVTLTKRILIDKDTTNEAYANIFTNTFNELDVNSSNYQIGRFDSSEKKTPSQIDKQNVVNKLALNSSRFVFANNFSVEGFTDCSKRINFEIIKADIDVLYFKAREKDSYKVALYVVSKQFQLHEIIGNKLLLSEGTYTEKKDESSKKLYTETFFVELSEDIFFHEYLIIEE